MYGYEDSALYCFRRAKELKLKAAYDLPIAHWSVVRRLIQEEADLRPAWRPTLMGVADSKQKLERKDEELELADVIVCPSRFVVDSLPNAIRERKRVVLTPFGSPTIGLKKQSHLLGRPLRVLFAGLLSQRKGLADLLAAVRMLDRKDVELIVMGRPLASMDFYRQYAIFTFEAGRPHSAVLDLMRSCDVFCLPSIVEGRALVIQEAMSQGLPVIITPNTGADDVVTEGVNGFVVPIRAPERIAEKIAWFADHRDQIPSMGEAAQRAAERFTWEAYCQTIISNISSLVD